MSAPRLLAIVAAALLVSRGAVAEDAPGSPPALETRWFDIGSITVGRDHFAPDSGPWSSTETRHPLFGGMGKGGLMPFGSATDVIELVRSAVPDAFSVDGSNVAAFGERLLRAVERPTVLDGVDATLRELARAVGTTFVVDVAILSGDAASTGGDVASSVGRTLIPIASARACGALRQQVAGRQGGEKAYVSSYDVEVAEKSATSDPIVDVGHDGLAFGAIVHHAAGNRIRLHVAAWWARAGWARSLTPKDTGEIRLPDVERRSTSATLDVVPGAWTLLPSSGAGKDGVVFTVRASARADDPVARPVERERASVRESSIGIGAAGSDAGAQGMSLRGYALGDLAAKNANARGPYVDLLPSNHTREEPPELEEAASAFPLDSLVDTLKAGDPWFAETESASLDLKLAVLWVRADDAHHALVVKRLDEIRERTLRASRVRLAVVRLPLASLPEYWTGLDDALVADGGAKLAARTGARLVDRLALRLASGQRGAAASGREHAYVRDYEVEVGVSAAIGDPVVASFFEGCALDLRASPTVAGGSVCCEVRLDRSDLQAIHKVATPHGALDAPAIGVLRMHGSLTLSYGSTRIVAANVEGADITLALLTATAE